MALWPSAPSREAWDFGTLAKCTIARSSGLWHIGQLQHRAKFGTLAHWSAATSREVRDFGTWVSCNMGLGRNLLTVMHQHHAAGSRTFRHFAPAEGVALRTSRDFGAAKVALHRAARLFAAARQAKFETLPDGAVGQCAEVRDFARCCSWPNSMCREILTNFFWFETLCTRLPGRNGEGCALVRSDLAVDWFDLALKRQTGARPGSAQLLAPFSSPP